MIMARTLAGVKGRKKKMQYGALHIAKCFSKIGRWGERLVTHLARTRRAGVGKVPQIPTLACIHRVRGGRCGAELVRPEGRTRQIRRTDIVDAVEEHRWPTSVTAPRAMDGKPVSCGGGSAVVPLTLMVAAMAWRPKGAHPQFRRRGDMRMNSRDKLLGGGGRTLQRINLVEFTNFFIANYPRIKLS